MAQNDLNTFLTFGSFHYKKENYEKSKNIFLKCIEISPDDFRGYFNLGKVYSQLNNLDDAIICFEKVIELNSTLIESYSSLASCLIRKKESQLAIKWCKKGLEINQKDFECIVNLNIALRQVNLIDEALEFTRSHLSHITTITQSSNHLIQSPQSNKITIVLLKWGIKYSNEYVNRLINSILQLTRQSTIKISIVCFTDHPQDNDLIHDENVEYRQLPEYLLVNGWSGWWYKAYLFSEEANLFGTIFYIDLDTVICSSTFLRFFTELSSPNILTTQSTTNSSSIPISVSVSVSDIDLSINSSLSVSSIDNQTTTSIISSSLSLSPLLPSSYYYFACLGAQYFRNEGRLCGINSSIMIWNASNSKNSLRQLYTQLLVYYNDITKVMYKFDHYLEFMLYPSRLNNSQFSLIFLQDYFPNVIIDYYEAIELTQNSSNFPQTTSIICFPLSPKPHEVSDLSWVKKWWKREIE